jgi:tail protein
MTVDVCAVTPDVTATLRGLVMHPTDPPVVLLGFNPWNRQVRADAESPNAWADGGWSGAEWNDALTVPIRLLVYVGDARPGTRFWWAQQQRVTAAFAASSVNLPLDFEIANPDTGGDAYVLYGRPRLVEPLAETALRGWASCSAAFVALDPTIYHGPSDATGLRSGATNLPSEVGGLTFSAQFPVIFSAVVTAGRILAENTGTAPTGLTLTLTTGGPLTQPRVTLLAGTVSQTLQYNDVLQPGQTLVIDTKARTVYLDGTSRRGKLVGDWFLLPPGSSEIRFNAAAYEPTALLVAEWRDAWS